MTRAKMKLADPSNEPVREQPDLIRVQSLLLDRRGVGSCEVRGLLPTSLGWFWGRCGVGGEIGLVGFAGKVVVYCGVHVVIGIVSHGYAYVELAKVHSAAMVLGQNGQVHQRGSRKGEVSGPWFAEPPNNKLAGQLLRKSLGSAPSAFANTCRASS
jgi:hypothetical protein